MSGEAAVGQGGSNRQAEVVRLTCGKVDARRGSGSHRQRSEGRRQCFPVRCRLGSGRGNHHELGRHRRCVGIFRVQRVRDLGQGDKIRELRSELCDHEVDVARQGGLSPGVEKARKTMREAGRLVEIMPIIAGDEIAGDDPAVAQWQLLELAAEI